jgi:hypothetical protein
MEVVQLLIITIFTNFTLHWNLQYNSQVVSDNLQGVEIVLILSKSKAIPVTGLGGLKGCEMLRISHCLDSKVKLADTNRNAYSVPSVGNSRMCMSRVLFEIVPTGKFIARLLVLQEE